MIQLNPITARLEMRARRNQQAALDAFLARKAEIGEMLARIQSLSDAHFNTSPDAIHWGHVGDLDNYAGLLKRITDAAFKEGEHAE
jgi:hypothetical protein